MDIMDKTANDSSMICFTSSLIFILKLVAAFYEFIYPLLLLDYKNIKFGDSTNA